jgi:site-specific recombinase XerD
MLERFVRYRRVAARLRGCVLGASLDDFVAHLARRRYGPERIKNHVRVVVHFARWMESTGGSVEQISEETVRSYLAHIPRCRCRGPHGQRHGERSPLRQLLVFLRAAGTIGPPGSDRPIDAILARFDTYLRSTCGLAAITRPGYLRHVGKLLEDHYGNGAVVVADLAVGDVLSYILRRAARCAAGTMQNVVKGIRSFLRYLRMEGLCAWADGRIPSVHRWKLSRLPRVLTADQIHALLGSFDRKSAIGRRDFAIALCLVRLGLRAGEVAHLELDDIDWRSGTVRIVRSKSGRATLLPLPAAVGRAIIAYLRRGRPSTDERRIFVCHLRAGAPFGTDVVRAVVARGFHRAGLPGIGPHALRHAAASRMLRAGTPIKDLADVLGHQRLDTTLAYARVDLPKLAEVALPWPGASA